ncbi:MAG: SDR family NAD(P)-dependent oxidoreductase, partial [Flavobacteriaceae bacterium]|nr:SDR family NAD(P)-dependent oxidoreductase [Flavobacteriaceae bacterium]
MKSALVTGGSRGIGRAICVKLAQDSDYHILINYRSNKKEAKQTLKQVEEQGGSAELLPFDVADFDEVKNSLETWLDNNPKSIIEVIINN